MLNRKGLTEFWNLLGKDDHCIFFFERTAYIFLPLVYNETGWFRLCVYIYRITFILTKFSIKFWALNLVIYLCKLLNEINFQRKWKTFICLFKNDLHVSGWGRLFGNREGEEIKGLLKGLMCIFIWFLFEAESIF